MFAVIRTGGKQYRVSPNDIIEIEKVAGNPGDIVELSEVLLLGGEGAATTGSPTVSGAMVAAEVVEQNRGEKVIVFKKKRRQGYRRTHGHRQELTALRITEILTDGKKPSKAAAKPAPTKTESAEKPAAKAEAAPAKKAAPAEKAPAKKAAEDKSGDDKAPAKKAAANKAPAKKAPAKKTAAKKAPAKKAPAKKS